MPATVVALAAVGAVAAVVAGGSGSASGQPAAPAGSSVIRLTGTTSPARTGTASAPLPIAATFTVTDAPTSPGRPATASFVRVRMAGLVLAPGSLPQCTTAQIAAAGGTRTCPRGSQVGSGTFDATMGATGDQTSVTGSCHLDLTFFAAGSRQLTLYVSGGPAAPSPCPADVSTAVPVGIGRPPGATSVSFGLPGLARHPVSGFDAALSQLVLRFPGTPVRVGRRTVLFVQSAGGCSRGRRRVSGTVQTENGATVSPSSYARCATPRPPRKPRRTGRRHR